MFGHSAQKSRPNTYRRDAIMDRLAQSAVPGTASPTERSDPPAMGELPIFRPDGEPCRLSVVFIRSWCRPPRSNRIIDGVTDTAGHSPSVRTREL